MKATNILIQSAILILLSFSALAVPIDNLNADETLQSINQFDDGSGAIQVEEQQLKGLDIGAIVASFKCGRGKWSGPYTFSSLGPSNDAKISKVLAVAKPWKLGSKAYIWSDNTYTDQMWWLECRGFQTHDQLNKYYIRYAYNTNLCLTAKRKTSGTILSLQTCGNNSGIQSWEMKYTGRYWSIVKQKYVAAYNFIYEGNDSCIDVYKAGNKNRTPVELWHCNGQTNQLWTPELRTVSTSSVVVD